MEFTVVNKELLTTHWIVKALKNFQNITNNFKHTELLKLQSKQIKPFINVCTKAVRRDTLKDTQSEEETARMTDHRP